MNLSPKYIAAIVFSVFAIFAWNGFLIVRDAKMFEAHDSSIKRLMQPPSDSILSPKEKYCQQQAKWHPDCNLE